MTHGWTGTNIQVSGWIMATQDNQTLRFLIDGEVTSTFGTRPQAPGTGIVQQSPMAFYTALNLSPTNHTLEIINVANSDIPALWLDYFLVSSGSLETTSAGDSSSHQSATSKSSTPTVSTPSSKATGSAHTSTTPPPRAVHTTPIIIGATAGAALLVIIAVVCACMVWRRRRLTRIGKACFPSHIQVFLPDTRTTHQTKHMLLAYSPTYQCGVARRCPQRALPVPPRPICIRSHRVPQAVPCTHPRYPNASTTLPFPLRSTRVDPQPQHKSLLTHKRPKTLNRANLRTRETP